MMNYLAHLRLPLFFIGLFLFFISERYLDLGTNSSMFTGLALILMIFSIGLSFLKSMESRKLRWDNESRIWIYMVSWQALVLLGPVFYLVYKSMVGDQDYSESSLQKILLGFWLLCIVLGGSWGLGLELARISNGKGELAEPFKVMKSGLTWLLVGMMLAGLVSVNYSASQKNRSYDLSYFKTTAAGDSSLKMARSLEKKMEVAIFFPDSNEVKPLIDEYFNSLQSVSEFVSVTNYDKDLHPNKAEEFRVSKNGVVILRYNNKRERIDIGLTQVKARSKLKKLDSLFQKAFLKITSTRSIAYFTSGHGEMTWSGKQKNPFRSIRGMEQILRALNYTVKKFGVDEGSLQQVPKNPTFVGIMGPTEPFLREEIVVLEEYLDKGGKLLVLFDIERQENKVKNIDDSLLMQMLKKRGIAYKRVMLANEKKHVVAMRTQVDKWFLFTNIFGSHQSVQSLNKHEEKIQVMVFQTGYLDLSGKVDGWQVSETIKSTNTTFGDLNRNFKFDPDEKKKTYSLGAVASASGGGEILAFADATAISDALIRNGGNQLLISDTLKWLGDKGELTGEVASEEDVKIRFSRTRENYVFFASIFAVPSLVMLVGGLVNTRRRERKVLNNA